MRKILIQFNYFFGDKQIFIIFVRDLLMKTMFFDAIT